MNTRRNVKGEIVPSTFRVQVKDVEFANSVAKSLREIGMLPRRRTEYRRDSSTEVVITSSIELYHFLHDCPKMSDLFPSIIDEFPMDFVRGVYESDGCCWKHTTRNIWQIDVMYGRDYFLVQRQKNCLRIRDTDFRFMVE